MAIATGSTNPFESFLAWSVNTAFLLLVVAAD
jgi:hypothetical protein